ncbi:MAG: hypothetical protein FJY97_10570 [candidate division Zixibacteria bacterium]|nr:hypothetical protein [candidate division Zixibacteria bacterium]
MGVSKKDRLAILKHLIRQNEFVTQDEIIRVLQREGVTINQGTVSKDLKTLRVVKTRTQDNRVKYALPYDHSGETQDELLRSEIHHFVHSAAAAVNLVVVKTASGRAASVCETIDQTAWPEILGSIAGDNTILLITETAEQAKRLLKRLHRIMEAEKKS